MTVALAAVFGLMVISQLWFNDRRTPQENIHLAVAARVAQLGVASGSRVGVIGESSNATGWVPIGKNGYWLTQLSPSPQ